LTNSS
jgi:hypothetical protein